MAGDETQAEDVAKSTPIGAIGASAAQVAATLHSTALEQAGPPSALVDGGQTILHLSPTAGRFILHSAGVPSNLLPAVVRPELRLKLRLALGRALDQRLPTLTQAVVVAFEGERRRVAMHVAPVPGEQGGGRQALVSFLDGGALAVDEGHAVLETQPDEVARLHAELKTVQEGLVESRSDHDATIQDLRATNEKLERLSVVHSDLQNLTAITEVGTLLLDSALRIKMFTPPVLDIFNITKSDIGRVVTDFTNRLNHPALVEEAQQVLRHLAPIEREVQASTGRFYLMHMRPHRTVEDRIEGVVLTFVDITARLKVELALGRSEQQFRALVRASSQVLYRMSAHWTEMRELFGGDFLSPMEAPSESWLQRYIPAEDRERVQAMIQKAIDAKGIFDLEHRVIREDGTIGWTHSRAIPILDLDGTITEWFGTAYDVTSQHRAQLALRESEDRLRVLVEGVPQHVWRAERGGAWTWSSPQWHRYTGLSDAESRGNGWLAAVHPDDRNRVLTAWYAAANSGLFEVECRIRYSNRPEYRWFRGRAAPLRDARARITEWLGTFTDVDDLRALHGRQEILLAELQHRVRNIMAVIRTMAARTAENSATVPEYAASLKGRLEALARTQVILTRQAGAGVDLERMMRDELLVQTAQADKVYIGGPKVTLSAKAAEVLTLAVHELTTNAVKYGALSAAGGSLRVTWEVKDGDEDSLLTLRWTESGTNMDASRRNLRGFGTELIEARVPYELNGTGQLEMLPEGARAVISFPLRPGDSILQTDSRSLRPRHGAHR